MTLDRERARQAASLLLRHWRNGTRLDALPEDLRPADRAEGYAIQAELMAGTAQPLFGWKIAATSLAGQRHINVDGPLAGRILAERVIPDGATVSLAGNAMRVAEAELAFRFGRDLPPRPEAYPVDEVMTAVATLHPAIEIPDSRYTDFTLAGAPQLIADNACAHLFMLGPAVETDWRGRDLAAHEISATLNSQSEFHGRGANVLGDPRIALTWLVNELSTHGIPLLAGQVVTTGTCVTPVPILPGDEVRAGYGDFGALSISFARDKQEAP
jgi:2-keto-4-pentenoate hydratase